MQDFVADIKTKRWQTSVINRAAPPTFKFFRGDSYEINLSLLDGAIPFDASDSTPVVAIGQPVGSPPSAGKFKLGYGAAVVWIEYTAAQGLPTAAAIATALNTLAGVTAGGGVTVLQTSPGNYQVAWNTVGVRDLFQGDGKFLDAGKVLIGRVRTGDADYQDVQQIRLDNAAFATASGFVLTTPTYSFAETAPGVYSLRLPSQTLDATIGFGGDLVSLGASSGAMKAALTSAGITAQVQAVDANTWVFYGEDIPEPTVTLRTAQVLTATLSFKRPELEAAFSSGQESLSCVMELKLYGVDSTETPIQTRVTVSRTVLEDPSLPAGDDSATYMLTAVYDTNGNGIVDRAEAITRTGGVITGDEIQAGLAGNLKAANNLSDVADPATALGNLGGAMEADLEDLEDRVQTLEESLPVPVFAGTAPGLVPDSTAAPANSYLRKDGSWVIPAGGGGGGGDMLAANNLSDLDNVATARVNIGAASQDDLDLTDATVAAQAGLIDEANGRIDDLEIRVTALEDAPPGSGDLLAANNLSDVDDVDTARGNLGAASQVQVDDMQDELDDHETRITSLELGGGGSSPGQAAWGILDGISSITQGFVAGVTPCQRWETTTATHVAATKGTRISKILCDLGSTPSDIVFSLLGSDGPVFGASSLFRTANVGFVDTGLPVSSGPDFIISIVARRGSFDATTNFDFFMYGGNPYLAGTGIFVSGGAPAANRIAFHTNNGDAEEANRATGQEAFRVYTLEQSAGSLRFYIDGVLYLSQSALISTDNPTLTWPAQAFASLTDWKALVCATDPADLLAIQEALFLLV